jgi:hypothetical protein
LILIAGDSFSDTFNTSKNEPSLTSWPQLIELHSKCIQRGKSGYSNWDILRSIRTAYRDHDISCVVVNLTHPSRHSIYFNIPNHSTQGRVATASQAAPTSDMERRIIEVSNQCAKRIIAMPHVVCWSPFPHYESWSEVHTIYLERENEMYTDGLDVVGCHFTQQGNDQMAKIIKQLMKEMQ